MDDFYIFLDIDGVMYDWKYVLSLPKRGGRLDRFNPKSVSALNILTKKLSQFYQTHLVISSSWRHDMTDTKNTLIKNGVDLSNLILEATPISNSPLERGKELLSYFNGDVANKNYVIIDDEMGDYLKYFPRQKIIKTNMIDGSLDICQVHSFLKANQNNYFDFNM